MLSDFQLALQAGRLDEAFEEAVRLSKERVETRGGEMPPLSVIRDAVAEAYVVYHNQ